MAETTPSHVERFAARLDSAWQQALAELSQHRRDARHWTGELSTSALSTATAISALVQMRVQAVADESPQRIAVEAAIRDGCGWLHQQQNRDGGFGDTDRSRSNIATTLLVLAAWELAGQSPVLQPEREAAWSYVRSQGGWQGLRDRYGRDKTFVVPILSNCALANLVKWSEVAPLPFEAAWLPQELYRWARMPVVSYAVPALVAIGQAVFHFNPPRNPLLRAVRRRAIRPTLAVLRRMQPASGGYLEAVPLTSFVLMNLAAIGHGDLPVAKDCLKFILDSRLADGSWPIDTNLATWVTSLSIEALACRGGIAVDVAWTAQLADGHALAADDDGDPAILDALANASAEASASSVASPNAEASPSSSASQRAQQRVDNDWPTLQWDAVSGSVHLPAGMIRWLLSCQHKQKHPFTGANPGGWGWTDLSGAVPDADDTPAALLALSRLDLSDDRLARLRHQVAAAAAAGLGWMYRLQNRDGGMPTFCRGWGKLPFDRSGTDLTAHALRAIHAWLPRWAELNRGVAEGLPTQRQLTRSLQRGLAYLERRQQSDGSWLPLWFGNQDRTTEDNPIYGTGRVLLCYADLGLAEKPSAARGRAFLTDCQNADGGWGGGINVGPQSPDVAPGTIASSSIEETGVALHGLLACGGHPLHNSTIMRGLEFLADRIAHQDLDRAWPIGFYFAKLWYYERLYPTVFSLGPLGVALARMSKTHGDDWGLMTTFPAG